MKVAITAVKLHYPRWRAMQTFSERIAFLYVTDHDFSRHSLTPSCYVSEPGVCCSKEPCLSQLEEEDEGRTSMATDNSDHVYSSTCSLQRRISSSLCYSPGPGHHFDPITELSCEEDDGERKRREKQRSVSCT